MSRITFGRRPRTTRTIFAGATLALAAGLGLWTLDGRAEPTAAGPNDRYISRVVAKYLTDVHLGKHPLDDEMSARAYKNFLKSLDPLKLYFTQADVDEFSKYEKQLDDMVQKGDVSFGFLVYQRFLQRVDERLKTALAQLEAKHDYTIDEEFVTDGKKLDYAKTDAEIEDRWRRRIKYDLLVQKADKVDEAEAKTKLTRRYTSFDKRMHQVNNDDLVEMFLNAITNTFDPHTTYMSDSTGKNFNIVMSLNLEGIGASLQYEDGYTKVNKIIPGGPADKDGRLKPEDRIVAVSQGANSNDWVDVVDTNLNDVVKLIRGNPKTTVRLKVQVGGVGEPKIYDLVRDKIALKDSEAQSEIFEVGNKPNGRPYKVGVINLPSFYLDADGARAGKLDYKSATRDVKKLLEDFNAKGVDVCILDLRKNGGGSLPEAISLTGLFVDRGPIVQVKDQDGNVQGYDDEDAGATWNGPLVVLCSKFSASASEILAGAIKDYDRGLIIGDKTTHGKGTVQSLLDLGQRFFRTANPPEFGVLKITMQQFYRPNGESTQLKGVVSDIELPSITTHLDVGEADLEYAVAFDKVPALPLKKENRIEPRMIDELRALSAQRVSKSEEFQKEEKKIANYEELKNKKRVSLNEATFMKERAELDSEKAEAKELEELNDPNAPVVKRDYYFNEAIDIALDYIRLGGKLASK